MKSICEKGNAPGNVWSASSMFSGNNSAKLVDYALATSDDNPFVKVFPNPAADRLNVAMNLQKDFNGTLMFTDASGRMVRAMNINRQAGNYTDGIDLGGLAPGMYILHMQDADFRFIERVIIK